MDDAARRVLLLADAARSRHDRARAGALPSGGVGIVPGSLFFPDGRGGDSVRLSFSLVDEEQIDAGIAALA